MLDSVMPVVHGSYEHTYTSAAPWPLTGVFVLIHRGQTLGQVVAQQPAGGTRDSKVLRQRRTRDGVPHARRRQRRVQLIWRLPRRRHDGVHQEAAV
jgi:hypothetical protein